MALREENFVVLHSGSWNIKAGINVVDTNKTPTVTIRSLVGSRVVAVEPNETVEGESTSKPDEATEMTDGDDAENTDMKVEKPEQEMETIEESPEQAKEQESNRTQTIYYSGSALTEAQQQFPDSDLEVSTPIQDGIIKDWAAMEALWRHVLFKELGIKRSRNASPVLMVVPTEWTKEEHERITQIFFENFNVPGLYLAEEPLMMLYEITPILDTQIQRNAIQTIPLGGADFDTYFLELLKSDAQLVREYGEPLDLEFARYLKESSVCQVLGRDEKEVKARAQAEYNGKQFTVGNARYKAYEPLFNPDLVGKRTLNIIEAIHAAQFGCKAEKRQSLWESIIVTGGSCQVKGLQSRLQGEIEESLAVSENFGEFQIREIKFLKIPDYFPALKDSIVHTGFLGSEIVAKLIFPDPRNYINKVDYNESGPSVVHTKTF
ncbi:hypothetical protein BGZ76_000924 [Entomortierella beljakovae]|nr:hypothetical protein BGZ76_000924 [Entomortierella beljakovae]